MMKKFLIKIVIFLLPILLIWGALEGFYRTVPSNYTLKYKRINEKYKEIETLILGDSHAFFGINPEYLDSNAFNLAMISQSLYMDHLLFEKHKDSLPNLKNVVITVGYYSLSKLKNTKGEIWRKYFYQNQMDLEVPIISPFDIRQYSLSLTRRLNKSAALVRKYIDEGTIIGCDNKGWGNYYDVTNGGSLDTESWGTAKRHEDFLLDFEDNIARLQSIIDYCKKINCNVYIIDMPVYHKYLSYLNPDKLQKVTDACNTLVTDNTNVTYINLRSDARIESADFYDPDHLNHKGAKKYTQIINQLMAGSKNDD
ncbi:hypothetical protein [Aquimarina litoralis]|uniref:hypothetical protein n=1 Tax=Aquimarina litoralis TaxID=584605 RepID=UPI001C58E01E|nr:hypothetical protein [Aquimarina litoralis]MBW1294953.1 hypothetical protein [Aquimarina litoralis]